MSKYIDENLVNRKIILKTVHGKGLLTKVDLENTIEDGEVGVNCCYLLFSELDLDGYIEATESLDSYVYSGYWDLTYIEDLLKQGK